MLDSLDTLIGFALIFTIVSLLITILVQMVASLFNLRGRNLAWGVAESFEAMAPELKAELNEKGKRLADHLLKDPLLSDSQLFKMVGSANAVRSEELFALLHRIATGRKPSTPPEIKQDVITLLRNLGAPAAVFELGDAEMDRLKSRQAAITAELAKAPDWPLKKRLAEEASKIQAWLENAEATAEATALRWAAQGEAEIQKIYEKFEHSFETGQERSQEWFTTHARIITGILGLVAAFLLQLDAIDIYKQVSSNRELRASLVAQTTTLIGQADKILKTGPTVMEQSLKAIAKASNGTNDTALARAQLKDIPVSPNDTVETVKARIREAYTNRPPAELEQTLEAFDQETLQEVHAQLKASGEDWSTLQKSLDKSGFDLFPRGGSRWKDEPATPRAATGHLVGMLFAALLLSLGAPFWFNTLKSLASLRSSVAKNISDEAQAEQKNPQSVDTSKAPPTVK